MKRGEKGIAESSWQSRSHVVRAPSVQLHNPLPLGYSLTILQEGLLCTLIFFSESTPTTSFIMLRIVSHRLYSYWSSLIRNKTTTCHLYSTCVVDDGYLPSPDGIYSYLQLSIVFVLFFLIILSYFTFSS